MLRRCSVVWVADVDTVGIWGSVSRQRSHLQWGGHGGRRADSDVAAWVDDHALRHSIGCACCSRGLRGLEDQGA